MSIYALVDCNNFYVSCERAFNPTLQNKPVVILSNNDGCIVSRSNEAKALGIPMGAPFYQYEFLLRKHQAHVLSSNYTLYGDMSARVMHILRSLCPSVEVYSIDEAFLMLTELEHRDLSDYAQQIRQTIKQWTGLPVCIGIGATKTLAKVANYYAKTHTISGICDVRDPAYCHKILSTLNVKEIWGIGRKLTEKLKHRGIHTALQLRDGDPKHLRKIFSVTIERIMMELNGVACLEKDALVSKKNIIATRSFGIRVTSLLHLQEAVSNHIARAAIRLREQASKAQGIIVFIQTNRFHQPFYKEIKKIQFVYPTSDTTLMIKSAIQMVEEIFVPDLAYQKAGVVLTDIVPASFQQTDLFATPAISPTRDKLMQTLDKINHKMGANTLYIAAQGIERPWEMRSDKRSPSYTTHWDELPLALS